jgi:vacuolar protein sorting-associated protein 35
VSQARKTVAMSTVKSVLKTRCPLSDNDQIEKLFSFIQPVVKDEADQPEEEDDKEEFEEEQNLIAPLVQLFASDRCRTPLWLRMLRFCVWAVFHAIASAR